MVARNMWTRRNSGSLQVRDVDGGNILDTLVHLGEPLGSRVGSEGNDRSADGATDERSGGEITNLGGIESPRRSGKDTGLDNGGCDVPCGQKTGGNGRPAGTKIEESDEGTGEKDKEVVIGVFAGK